MLVALASQLARTAQVSMQLTTMTPVMPDMTIDRLVADEQQSGLAQVTGDLFWTPLQGEQGIHTVQIRSGEALIVSCA
jgi:hypothetical protein